MPTTDQPRRDGVCTERTCAAGASPLLGALFTLGCRLRSRATSSTFAHSRGLGRVVGPGREEGKGRPTHTAALLRPIRNAPHLAATAAQQNLMLHGALIAWRGGASETCPDGGASRSAGAQPDQRCWVHLGFASASERRILTRVWSWAIHGSPCSPEPSSLFVCPLH